MSRIIAALMCISLIGSPSALYAHGGGLDKCGCHIDNSTGVRHCHRGGSTRGTCSSLDYGTAYIAVSGVILVALVGQIIARALMAKRVEQVVQEEPPQSTRFTWDFTGSVDGNGAGAGVLLSF
jgi:hypothetical protein